MKNLTIFFAILISFVVFSTNNAKADTTYVDVDTVSNYDNLIFCDTDTLYVFNSNIPNPDGWVDPYGGVYMSPALIVTSNSLMHSTDGGTTWNTINQSSNGLWQYGYNFTMYYFYIYFTPPITEPWIDESAAICGLSDTLYVENYADGLYYRWYEVGVGILSEGYYPSDTALIVDHNGDYVVEIIGCSGSVFDTISMNITHTILPDLGPDQTFCGSSPINANLVLTQEYDWYLWSTTSTDSAITITSIAQSPDTVWVEVYNACVGIQRDTILLFQESYPNLDLGIDTAYVCPGNPITFSTGFEYDLMSWVYDWGGSEISNDSNITITPTQDTTVFVYVNQGLCPGMTDSVRIILVQPYEDNNVCVATVDTNGYNKVVWDRTFGVGIESYNIYRLNVSTYDLIGNVPIVDDPIFYDLGADPMVSANRYKIAAVDTCGNESSLSYYHGTIHITSSPAVGGGIDLTITDEYEDESGNYSPVEYYVMIDSLNDGHFEIIDTMSAAFSSYHIATPWSGATYALAAGIPWACEGAKSGTMSFSNRSAVMTDIEGIETKIPQIKVYPNPTTGIFQIDGNYDRIEIFNSIGQSVLQTEEKQVDLGGYTKGVYYVKVYTTYGPSTQKVILQ